ncbi:MAG: OmpH family outer membrane protein, partial [Candidatus Thorarchaeota archaeon]
QSRNLSDTIASAVPKMQSMTFATLSAKEQLITFANQAEITTEQVQKNFYYLSKSVMDLAGIHMPNLILSNKAAWPQIRDEAEKTDNTFTQVSQRIKDAWTWGLKDMLSGAKSFKDVMKGIWGTIKEQFFTLVAQLVSKWTLGFIGQIVTGSGGLLNSVKSVFGGIGKLLTGAEGGGGGGGLFGNIGGSFLGTIGKMAGPLGIGLLVGKMIGFKNISKTVQDAWKAASEVVIGSIKNIGKVSDAVFGAISDIVGGIGKAVGGLLSGIGGLLGGAGKKASDVTYWLKIIWENSQNILNQLVGFFHAKILHMIDQFRDIKRNTLLTSRFAEGARDRLKSIDAEIKALPSRLKIISKSIVDGLNSILSALTSKGTIYVNMTASKVIDSMTATLSNSISTVGKAEAIKKQLSTLELQLAAKLKDLQAKLVTATGDEKNALLKQMAMLEVQAQKKRQQLIDKLHDVQKATRESAITIREGVGRALKPMFQPVADAIRGLRGKMISAQHGAVITEPQLVMTHGTPSAPEYVLPSSALNRLLTMTSLSPVFHNTVNIYAQKLDDRTIDEAAQKIFAAIDWQARRRGYRL